MNEIDASANEIDKAEAAEKAKKVADEAAAKTAAQANSANLDNDLINEHGP